MKKEIEKKSGDLGYPNVSYYVRDLLEMSLAWNSKTYTFLKSHASYVLAGKNFQKIDKKNLDIVSEGIVQDG